MAVAEQLAERLGATRVLTDDWSLEFYSMDIYSAGTRPEAVVLPTSTAELQAAVATIRASGATIVPRGGGVSYTGGVVPPAPQTVVIDTSEMNRILEISRDNMYVTVEAGCTWDKLREHLSPEGLRTPFWGPLSGRYATVGGTVSQGAVLWGSARYGTSSDSVLGLEVVLADGSLITTGMGSVEGARPGWRHFGPDLTGLFLGDSGALGIKATVTLRLMESPAETGFLSYQFQDRDQLLEAMARLARAGLVSTGFALDPVLTDQRIRRGSIAQGAGSALSMIGSSESKLRAIRDAARMAARGRGFVGSDFFTLHLVAESSSRAGLDSDLERIRAICSRGSEIDNTIPQLLAARPFGSLTAALGPEGQRWSPLHVLVPLSNGEQTWNAVESTLDAHREDMTSCGIEAGMMLSTVSTTSFLLEVVIIWPGPRTAFYEEKLEAGKLRRYPSYDRSPDAERLVAELRSNLVDLFAELGGAHFQIGRRYRYLDRLDGNTRELLQAIKDVLDPASIMNPGVLGLGDEETTPKGQTF